MEDRYIICNETIYEQRDKRNVNRKYKKYILKDKNDNTYTCIVEMDFDTFEYMNLLFTSNEANKFDLFHSLFNHDIGLYNIIPKEFVTKEMDEVYNLYHTGSGNKYMYRSDRAYTKAYIREENRIRH